MRNLIHLAGLLAFISPSLWAETFYPVTLYCVENHAMVLEIREGFGHQTDKARFFHFQGRLYGKVNPPQGLIEIRKPIPQKPFLEYLDAETGGSKFRFIVDEPYVGARDTKPNTQIYVDGKLEVETVCYLPFYG